MKPSYVFFVNSAYLIRIRNVLCMASLFFLFLLLLCSGWVNYSVGRFVEMDDILLFQSVLILMVLSPFSRMSSFLIFPNTL